VEASGEVGVVKSDVPTVAVAVDRFFDDLKSRGLSKATIAKQIVLLKKQFLPWCKSRGLQALKQLGVDEVTQFRGTWADSPVTKQKKQERLMGFFHFCVAREWLRANPVAALRPVKVPHSPTLPFDPAQVAAVLTACEAVGTLPRFGIRFEPPTPRSRTEA
jgi:integrase/recombinase XerD